VWSDELFMEADSLPAGADLENMCCTQPRVTADERIVRTDGSRAGADVVASPFSLARTIH
jgi:hypothetical protein